MENSTSYTTLKDGFKIAINKSDTELAIEAEDQGNGNTFSGRFTDGTIKSMSSELFENIPELFEGLVRALKDLSGDQSVTVNPNGTIVFTQKLILEKHEKLLKFPILLKPIKEDSVNRLEETLKKVQKEVEELKSELSKVKNENQQLQNKLSIDYYEIVCPDFLVPEDEFTSQFEISEDRKTVAAIESSYCLWLLGTMLAREKNSKFRVKIEKLPSYQSQGIQIGVVVKNPIDTKLDFNTPAYYLKDKYLYQNNHSYGSINGTSMRAGTIISVHYIPSRSEIQFEIDGKQVCLTVIDVPYQKLDVFPCVRLPYKDITISFI